MSLYKIRRLVASLVANASWLSIATALLLFSASTYGLLFMAGETELIRPDVFPYWLVISSSTIGYGDFSPVTTAGMQIVAFWVVPIGLSLFAVVLTKMGMLVSGSILKKKKGLKMLALSDHIVIIGWNNARTLRLINLLLAEQNRHTTPVLLCVTDDIENPMPGKIEFVHAESFYDHKTMARCSLEHASRIVIDTPDDQVTLTTALYCNKVSPNSHKTAYFQEEPLGELLKEKCPKVECVPSVAVEMLAKSSLDPGSSLLHRQLLDTTEGMTQYAMDYNGADPLEVSFIFSYLKKDLDATLIGIRRKEDTEMIINPSWELSVSPGDTLYYISDTRIDPAKCFNF